MLTRVNLPHYLTALLELQSGSKVMQALCSFLAENNQVYFQKKPVMSYIIGLYFILSVRMLANQNNLLNHYILYIIYIINKAIAAFTVF